MDRSVFANDLEKAFNALTNYTSPGVYNSQVRGFMTGGSFTVNFPQDQVNFISITSPQVNAGCAGINVFFGGISYINGEEFVALLKGIAAGTLGESFAISVRTLCPVCATVLADLQKAAQAASELALNQCGAAMALLDAGINSVPGLQKYIRSRAAIDNGNDGQTGGFLKAFNEYTGDLTKAIDDHIKDLQAMTDPYQKQEELNKSPIGNSTWKYLSGMTKQQKIFIMSLLGTTVRTPIQTGNQTDLKQIPIAPSMTTDDLSKLFMFGASSTINQNLTVLECEDKNPYALWQCLAPQTTPIKQSYWYKSESVNANGVSLTDYGFYGLSYGLMFQAIQNVSEKKALDTPQTVTLPTSLYGANVQVKTNFSLDEIKGFLTLAYLPLYRAINIATFYPDISKQLVSNISEVVSAHYATAYLEDYILNLKKTDGQIKGDAESAVGNQGLSEKDLKTLQESIKQMRINLDSKLTLLLQNLQTQEVWINQVNQVESTIYQQILRNGLSENYAYSLGLSGM